MVDSEINNFWNWRHEDYINNQMYPLYTMQRPASLRGLDEEKQT